MTGIFQLFDRHHTGVSGRRISNQSHRSTLQHKLCHSQSADVRLEDEFNVSHQRRPADKNLCRNASDKQRFSTESSRASSSRSSSFSSVDYCKATAQPDHTHNDRITFSEASFENSGRSLSPKITNKSVDFRDVVKDSMLRESKGLSINTSIDSKRRDTLRDLKLLKPADRATTKLKEFCNEQRRMSDYGYKFKDGSRRSETRRLSFDSSEAFSTSKLKDLPRLSLDGREYLMRQADSDSSSNQQRRAPNVIAKLMGLTALPDTSILATQNYKSFIRNHNGRDGLDLIDTGKSIVDSSKAPSSKELPASVKWITYDMKPISSSRIHVEPAPWKSHEKGTTLLKHSSRQIRTPARQLNPISSVYSEIEKRFKDIEFTQSGKDLRALKQILESIRLKGLKEEEKQKQELTLIKPKQNNASTNQLNARWDRQTQILISKPKSRSPRSQYQTSKNMYNDHVVDSNEKCKATQHSSRSQQQQLKDNSPSSPRKFGSTSPRTRLKKLESEQQNQSPRSSSDASKHRVQVSKQQTESTSPGRKVPPKITNKEHNNKSRKASKEVTLACNKVSNSIISLPVNHQETAPEHPSPVSVLNISPPPYTDDSSTEERQITTPPEELAGGYDVIASEISRKKLRSVDRLVQKLKRLNSNHDESTTDYIAMLCDTTKNPDHRYITEILLASGLLLRQFGSDAKLVQLHNSGFLINPELFNVLEQTKSSAHTSINANINESRSQRRLVFDTINELLTKKLAAKGNLKHYTVEHQHSVAKKAITTQNLIKEVCGEMEQLSSKTKRNQENNNMESEDTMRFDNWNVFEEGMMSEVVLEIERSVFKKLVNETVVIITDYRLMRHKSGNRHNRYMK